MIGGILGWMQRLMFPRIGSPTVLLQAEKAYERTGYRALTCNGEFYSPKPPNVTILPRKDCHNPIGHSNVIFIKNNPAQQLVSVLLYVHDVSHLPRSSDYQFTNISRLFFDLRLR